MSKKRKETHGVRHRRLVRVVKLREDATWMVFRKKTWGRLSGVPMNHAIFGGAVTCPDLFDLRHDPRTPGLHAPLRRRATPEAGDANASDGDPGDWVGGISHPKDPCSGPWTLTSE